MIFSYYMGMIILKRCLIFGGSGFLGKNLCRHLLQKKDCYELQVYGRHTKQFDEFSNIFPNIKTITGEVSTEKDFYSLLKGIDIVFYLISATNASNKDMVLEFEQNVLPVIRLLEACKKYSVRFVFFSSGGTVYGLPKYVPIDEMHSTDPISPYGIHKLTLEKCIEYYGRTYGLDYLILRITNPYGMYQNPKKNQGAIAVFLAKAILGNTIEIWGDGNAVRDYIFVSDVMDACDALMHYQGKKIFNISSGRGYSLNEIVTEIYRQLRNRPIRVRYLPMRIQDVSVSILDNTLIGQETSWKPKINLQEGIRQMIKMWNPVTNKFDYGGS